MSSLFVIGRMDVVTTFFKTFFSIRLPRSLHSPHIYNSLKDCPPHGWLSDHLNKTSYMTGFQDATGVTGSEHG